MVWSGCKSWYLSPDGSNRSLYPGYASEYVLRARKLDTNDYECVGYADTVADTAAGAQPLKHGRKRPAVEINHRLSSDR